MNKAKELFDKILVDGQEIDLQALDANHGIYAAGKQKTLKVDFVLKKKDEIPAKIFSGLTALKTIKVPETVTTVGAHAFENTGAEITGLEQVEIFGEGALIGTYMSYMPEEFISYIQEHNPDAFISRYTAYEAAAYNMSLEGAWQYGRVKVQGVEAVEGVEGVKYTQEEIDAATIVAEKTTEDWKVEPVEAVEGKDAVLYTTEEIEAHNAELDIWEEGKVKEPAVEAVEGVEGVKYTQEEIDAAAIVAEKTTEDWKVEPVEAVEAVEEVLYTNEEVDAHNAEIEGAIKAGDIKHNYIEVEPGNGGQESQGESQEGGENQGGESQEGGENQKEENQTVNGEVTSENGGDTQIYNG